MKDFGLLIHKNLQITPWWESNSSITKDASFISENFKTIIYNKKVYHVVIDGELYNKESLINQLKMQKTYIGDSIESLILASFILWEHKMMDHLLGAFSVVIHTNDFLFVSKDQLGLRPIYYAKKEGNLMVSNSIEYILNTKFVSAIVSEQGLCELLALGPSISENHTLYKDIFSLGMGQYLYIKNDIEKVVTYYQPKVYRHTEDYEQTKHHVKYLIGDSIKRQSEACNASFLSGGLDSSILVANMNSTYNLQTYSLDYEENSIHFKGNDYQVAMDNEYIEMMVKQINSKHNYLVIQQQELISLLDEAMIARNVPGMADVDAALLWLCKKISPKNKIILSGECSDEIFGGYPWFYRKDLTQLQTFPWLQSVNERKSLLHDNLQKLPIYDYLQSQYHKTVNSVQYLEEDSEEDRLARKQTMLCLHWFMQTLITRQVCMAKHADMTIRAPFADVRILDYVYNIPWKMKYAKQQEKGLLRDAFSDILPKEVCYRKKNPFPKTHHPLYAELIQNRLKEALSDSNSILHVLFHQQKLMELIETKGASFVKPWYGQLMSGPQLLAYLYQIHCWANYYHVQLEY